jgi:excinuclease ABC subunit B
MRAAIDETERRRKIQKAYNDENGIIPQSVKKEIRELISIESQEQKEKKQSSKKKYSKEEKEKLIEQLTSEMRQASKHLEFERAAFLRDRIKELRITK